MKIGCFFGSSRPDKSPLALTGRHAVYPVPLSPPALVRKTMLPTAGPYQINGVPLRRVNQAYVIATSMKVDLSKVTIPVEDDTYFARVDTAKKTDEDQFFEQGSKVRLLSLANSSRARAHEDAVSRVHLLVSVEIRAPQLNNYYKSRVKVS